MSTLRVISLQNPSSGVVNGTLNSDGTTTFGGTVSFATGQVFPTYSGPGAPPSPAIGDTWFDTSVPPGALKVWNGSAWQSAGAGGTGGTVTSVNGSGGTTGLTLTGGPITASGTLTLGGILDVANGGTGASTLSGLQAAALPTQSGNSGKVLSTDGTNSVWVAAGGTGTVTSVDVSGGTTGLTTSGGPVTASGTITLAGILAVANGGTGASTLSGLQAAALPTQSGNSGKVLSTDGTNATWIASGGTGTVTSVEVSGGTTGLTYSGGPVTASGTITMAGTLGIANGGTGATTVAGAQANLLPDQAGNAGEFLQTDGAGVLSWAAAGGFPAGTSILFAQAAAPLGWVQDTSAGVNDRAIRLVNTAGGGTGGTIPFSTLFSPTASYTGSVTISSGQVGTTTLTTAELASHTHTLGRMVSIGASQQMAPYYLTAGYWSLQNEDVTFTGGGQGHTHSLVGALAGGNFTSNFDVNYVNVIICTKS